MELSWVSVVVAVLAVLVAYVKWSQSHWKRRGVVQTQPQFIFGDVWDALVRKKTLGMSLRILSRQFEKEPFFGAYKQMTPLLVVKDPELVNDVLVKHFGHFANNEIIFPEGKDDVFSDNPFFATMDRWKELRARLSTTFSPARVKTAFSDVADSCRCLADFVAAAGPDTTFDGTLLSRRFTAHASARVLFGIESHSLDVGGEPGVFYEMGHGIFNGNTIQTLRLICFLFCQWLNPIIGYEIVDRKIINFFRKLVHDSVEYRNKEGVGRDDLIQAAVKNLVVDGKVDEKLLRKTTGQVINSFVETFETSALTMSAALILLATNPKEQERLRQELRENIKPGKTIDYEQTNSLPILENVLKETLRLYPPADTLRRACTRPATLQSEDGRSVDLKPGDIIYVPVEAIHRDPAYYSHPDEFWPDHFTEEGTASRPKTAFLGWGAGPRGCPGMKYAALQVKAMLATLVHRFEILPDEKLRLPVQRDPTANLLSFVGGVWIKFRPVPF